MINVILEAKLRERERKKKEFLKRNNDQFKMIIDYLQLVVKEMMQQELLGESNEIVKCESD